MFSLKYFHLIFNKFVMLSIILCKSLFFSILCYHLLTLFLSFLGPGVFLVIKKCVVLILNREQIDVIKDCRYANCFGGFGEGFAWLGFKATTRFHPRILSCHRDVLSSQPCKILTKSSKTFVRNTYLKFKCICVCKLLTIALDD